jgi:hypothetical protein
MFNIVEISTAYLMLSLQNSDAKFWHYMNTIFRDSSGMAWADRIEMQELHHLRELYIIIFRETKGKHDRTHPTSFS